MQFWHVLLEIMSNKPNPIFPGLEMCLLLLNHFGRNEIALLELLNTMLCKCITTMEAVWLSAALMFIIKCKQLHKQIQMLYEPCWHRNAAVAVAVVKCASTPFSNSNSPIHSK